MDAVTLDLENITEILRVQDDRPPSSIERIPAGLGTRRFYRVRFSSGLPQSLVARVEARPQIQATDAARPAEESTWLPEPPLEPFRQFLEDAGLRVPHSIAHDLGRGIDLLEDLRDRTLLEVEEPRRSDLYRKACEIVPRLQRLTANPDQIPAFGRIFDRALIETKAWKWLHWTIPGLMNRPATEAESSSLRSLFEAIATLLDEAPRRLAHRDFKAENLHLVPAATSADEKACELVMIDVQGAFMAPPEYDLVCLLYDLQVDLDEKFAMECFRSTLPRLPDAPDPGLAALRFDAIATLRLCKDVSHLVDARQTRNDVRRWHEIPRGLRLLESAAGRLSRTFPEARALTSVIQTLTLAMGSSDSG